VTEHGDTTANRRAAEATRSTDGAKRFFEMIVADPAALERLPDDATVVVVPPDEPAVAAANIALAEQIAEEARPEYLWVTSLGGADSLAVVAAEEPLLAFRPSDIPWVSASDPGQRIVYDPQRDTLLLELSGGARRSLALRPDAAAYFVMVDVGAGRAFGYLIPHFLGRAAREVPRLATLLVDAEFRRLRQEELGGVDEVLLRPSRSASNDRTDRQDAVDIRSLAGDIALLSA
jgi:hypothetical protein